MAIGAPIFWFFGLIAIVWIGVLVGIVLIVIGIGSDLLLQGIVVTLIVIFSGYLIYFLAGSFGPYVLYVCEACKKRSPVPIFPCRSCGKLTAKYTLRNHVVAIFYGCLFLAGVFHFFADAYYTTTCSMSMAVGASFAILFGFQTWRYKTAARETQIELDQGRFPHQNYTDAGDNWEETGAYEWDEREDEYGNFHSNEWREGGNEEGRQYDDGEVW